MRLVVEWLREIVAVPDDPDAIARELGLRGFEVAAVEPGPPAVIDFEITANRPDCLSHIGLAREASAIWGLPLRMSELTAPPAGPAEALEVTIEDPDLCPRYCAQVFEVRVVPSPPWMAHRLEAAGVRPINSVVDATNYVMLELGQPMHAFDLDRLEGRAIVVRRARPGEPLTTLDGVERRLDPEMLVIADATRATAIGGVMGGADSEISGSTRLIALESAHFHPSSVRRTSKRLGLKTEASTRFERGADIAAPPAGIARFAALLGAMDAGTPRGGLLDRYPAPRAPGRITLRASRIHRVLGQEVPPADVERILEPLGFEAAGSRGDDGLVWSVRVPSYRVDVTREVDLIEEVGRHFGFDRLPVTFPALRGPQAPPDPRIARDRLLRRVLAAAGFSEATTFAFIERAAAQPFGADGESPAGIANPLSEKFAVLRPSLIPGLVDSAAHNRRRERRDVRLFEIGARFTAAGEERAAALVWCGAADGPHWSAPTRPVDFYDVKGTFDQLGAALGVDAEWEPAVIPFLVPGRASRVTAGGPPGRIAIGIAGQLRPDVADARGFPAAEPLYAAELWLDAVARAASTGELRTDTLPRFPSVVRDLSILVDEALPAASVRGTIRSSAPSTLVSIVEFDRYTGTGVPEGRISLSLRLTFRSPDRTLTDDEVERATAGIVEALQAAHGAERR